MAEQRSSNTVWNLHIPTTLKDEATTIFPTSYVPIVPGQGGFQGSLFSSSALCLCPSPKAKLRGKHLGSHGWPHRKNLSDVDAHYTYPPSKSKIAKVKPQFLHKEIDICKWWIFNHTASFCGKGTSKFGVHYLKYTVDGAWLPWSLLFLALYVLAFVGLECEFSMTTPLVSSFPSTPTKAGWDLPTILGNEFEVLGPKPVLRLFLLNCHEVFLLTCFFRLRFISLKYKTFEDFASSGKILVLEHERWGNKSSQWRKMLLSPK